MLFNSYVFIFVFLPVTIFGYFLIQRYLNSFSLLWVVICSLFFYAWWDVNFLWVIIISIIFNYKLGLLICERERYKKILLSIGIIFNLLLLTIFKYANFLIESVDYLFELEFPHGNIILPLAISFFTFQQIAYIVDIYKGRFAENNFLRYVLFVTFFPQLIAGPIVHHSEMLSQFKKNMGSVIVSSNLAIGFTIFVLGLFKKVIIADGFATFASPVFIAAEKGLELTFFEAWGGSLAYTFQLYFDFSGYSDMAIGLARIFGIRLPINFLSPYKAKSIIEFWRRWHITLSRFLKEYLYIPLGGNRNGEFSKYFNLIVTMSLGGLWHGAGINFILWGIMHGLLLIINNIYRKIFKKQSLNKIFSWFITFLSVSILWVIFRAESLSGAIRIYKSMFGFNGISLPQSLESNIFFLKFNNIFSFNGMFTNGIYDASGILWTLIIFPFILFLPNIAEIFSLDKDVYIKESTRWKKTSINAFLVGILFGVSILTLSSISEFLYFQF